MNKFSNNWIDISPNLTIFDSTINGLAGSFRDLITYNLSRSYQINQPNFVKKATQTIKSFALELSSLTDPSKPRHKSFFENVIPLFIEFANTKHISSLQTKKNVTQFYQQIISQCCENLEIDPKLYLSILSKILNKNSYLFDNIQQSLQNEKYKQFRNSLTNNKDSNPNHFQNFLKSNNLEMEQDAEQDPAQKYFMKMSFSFSNPIEDEKRIFIANLENDQQISLFFFLNIQFFGVVGGFEKMVLVTQNSSDLELAQMIVSFSEQIFPYVSEQVKKQILEIFNKFIISIKKDQTISTVSSEKMKMEILFSIACSPVETDDEFLSNFLVNISKLLNKGESEYQEICFEMITNLVERNPKNMKNNLLSFIKTNDLIDKAISKTTSFTPKFVSSLKKLIMIGIQNELIKSIHVKKLWALFTDQEFFDNLSIENKKTLRTCINIIAKAGPQGIIPEISNVVEQFDVKHITSNILKTMHLITKNALQNKNPIASRQVESKIKKFLQKITKSGGKHKPKDANNPDPGVLLIQDKMNDLQIPLFSMNIMWKIIHNEVFITKNIENKSKEYFKKNLFFEHAKIYQEYFKLRCLFNLIENKYIPSTLDLFNILLLETSNSFGEEISQEIYKAEKKLKLIDLVINDLRIYLLNSIEVTNSLKKTRTENKLLQDKQDFVPNPSGLLAGNLSHLEEIKIRLSFIETILSKSKITIAYEQIERIWELIVDNPITEKEVDVFFDWLRKIRVVLKEDEVKLETYTKLMNNHTNSEISELESIQKDDNFISMAPQALKKVFKEKICKIEPLTIRSSQFKLFVKYFIYCNIKSKKIEYEYVDKAFKTVDPIAEKELVEIRQVKSGDWKVVSPNLDGLDYLVSVIISAIDNNLSESAIAFYCQIFTLLKMRNPNKIRVQMISNIMDGLQNSFEKYDFHKKSMPKLPQKRRKNKFHQKFKNKNKNKNIQKTWQAVLERRISRFVMLLGSVVTAYDKMFRNSFILPQLTPQKDLIGISPKTLVLSLPKTSAKQVSFRTFSSIPLKIINQIFAKKIGESLENFVLLYNQKELNIKEDDTLNLLGDDDIFTFTYQLKKINQNYILSNQTSNEEKGKCQFNPQVRTACSLVFNNPKSWYYGTSKSDRLPARFLLLNKNFRILSSLFKTPSYIADEVYHLLSMLPIHKDETIPFFELETNKIIFGQNEENFEMLVPQPNQENENTTDSGKSTPFPLKSRKLDWAACFNATESCFTLLYRLEMMKIFLISIPNEIPRDENFYSFRNKNLIKYFTNTSGFNQMILLFCELFEVLKKEIHSLEDEEVNQRDLEFGLDQEMNISNKFRSSNSLSRFTSTNSFGELCQTYKNAENDFKQYSLFRYALQLHPGILRVLDLILRLFIFVISEEPFEPLDFLYRSKTYTPFIKLSNEKIISPFIHSLFEIISELSRFSFHNDVFLLFRSIEIQKQVEEIISVVVDSLLLISFQKPSLIGSFILQSDPRSIDSQDKTHFLSLLESSLIKSSSSKIRNSILKLILNLSQLKSLSETISIDPNDFFFSHLVSFFDIISLYPQNAEQFFKILRKIISFQSLKIPTKKQNANETQKINSFTLWDNSGSFFDFVWARIEHLSEKERTTSIKDTELIAGEFIRLFVDAMKLEKLRNKENFIRLQIYFAKEKRMIEKLLNFLVWIFCTQAAQKSAKKLLLLLLDSNEENLDRLVNSSRHIFAKLRESFQEIRVFDSHSHPNSHSQRSSPNTYGYVGLKNQGATCYMNSILQQLFWVEKFRTGILNLDEGIFNEKNPNPSLKVLQELRTVFQNLLNHRLVYYDTKPFCKALQNANLLINLSEQQDANEFLLALFDQVKEALSKTKEKDILNRIFGLELYSQVTCLEKSHLKEKSENFLSVSIDVKNNTGLVQSLQNYVQCEILKGENKFSCPVCETPVEASKQYSFKTLPNTLIIHLKRFEYNSSISQSSRINSYFEFPFKLDMAPYTIKKQPENGQNYPNEYFEYNLVGVVIHSGRVDSGHYYSFIQDRIQKTGDKAHNPENWLEFNDTKVSLFDINTLEENSFGEIEIDGSVIKKKPYSAYILFYERTFIENIPLSDLDQTNSHKQSKEDRISILSNNEDDENNENSKSDKISVQNTTNNVVKKDQKLKTAKDLISTYKFENIENIYPGLRLRHYQKSTNIKKILNNETQQDLDKEFERFNSSIQQQQNPSGPMQIRDDADTVSSFISFFLAVFSAQDVSKIKPDFLLLATQICFGFVPSFCKIQTFDEWNKNLLAIYSSSTNFCEMFLLDLIQQDSHLIREYLASYLIPKAISDHFIRLISTSFQKIDEKERLKSIPKSETSEFVTIIGRNKSEKFSVKIDTNSSYIKFINYLLENTENILRIGSNTNNYYSSLNKLLFARQRANRLSN
ncbi:ubiquitin carboxyl-terminal hydrolase [Anaeramoeba ignava]|uniref:Ubiquitin carboxyl-terminal hydrolase n=1 Tax=Anaeramoeba ignava TaxID=1746090 RepID=A0A9Q0LKF8_ANAIG|nr:ubiquitin carboxyl-terminal hydrolase [Anaeramoeba ignava]